MHAFPILAHDDPRMCARLASRLAEAGDVFVHVDARADMASFAEVRRHADVLDSRVRVRWGGWSIVRASCLLASRALENPEVEALTLVSGRHYPVLSPRQIVAQEPRERIRLIPSPDASAGKPREKFDRRYISRFAPGSAASVLTNAVARRLPALDACSALDGRRLYAGSTWWSLTRGTYVEALASVDRDRRFREHFSRLVAPDESLLHTAVGHVLEQRHDAPAPRTAERETTYVRWAGGRHPEPLTRDDIDTAREEGWWFARKFSSTEPELLEYAEAGWS